MPDRSQVLIVDDDPNVRAMLTEYLGDHEFEAIAVDGGPAMREALARQVPQVILLDLHLQGEDGISLARYLRERHSTPIIMVTAASDMVDRIVGLEIGAADYIAKPFDPRELLARVRSVLRRTVPQARTDPPPAPAPTDGGMRRIAVGRCWLEVDSRRLLDDSNEEVALTAMEFEVLCALCSNPNRILSREQLLQHSRSRELGPFDRSVDICIARLRRKIEVDPAKPRAIRTARGAGYSFEPASGSADG